MKTIYHVRLSGNKEAEFAAELIAKWFTFSYSKNAGFKVSIDSSDTSSVREFSVMLHRRNATATNGVIAEILPAADFIPSAERDASGKIKIAL